MYWILEYGSTVSFSHISYEKQCYICCIYTLSTMYLKVISYFHFIFLYFHGITTAILNDTENISIFGCLIKLLSCIKYKLKRYGTFQV